MEAASFISKRLERRIAKSSLFGSTVELQQCPGDTGGAVRKAGQIAMRCDGLPTPAVFAARCARQQNVTVPHCGVEQPPAAALRVEAQQHGDRARTAIDDVQ